MRIRILEIHSCRLLTVPSGQGNAEDGRFPAPWAASNHPLNPLYEESKRQDLCVTRQRIIRYNPFCFQVSDYGGAIVFKRKCYLGGFPMTTASSRVPGLPASAFERGYYFHMAVVCAVVAFLGFAPTYWMPMTEGRLNVPPVIHVHALVFFMWALFLVAQTWLAATRRLASHRAMGMFAISLATTMTIMGVLVAIDRMRAAAAAGQKEAGLAFSIVPLGSILLFAVIFGFAVANVRRPDWHKRLMLAGSISILDAPIARWFITFLAPEPPSGPPPVAVDIGPSAVALILLGVAMFADRRNNGRIHRAYWIVCGAYVALKVLQVPLSATAQWHTIADWIMRLAG